MTRFFGHGQSILQVFETSIALSMVKSVKSQFFSNPTGPDFVDFSHKPRIMDGRGGEDSRGEAGSMEDDRRHYRQRGATTHRLKAPVLLEEEGNQEGGGQSTDEYR